ncbi:peptidase C39 family protein [Arsenicicoccus sp. oral taxon 190]|uniref:peptidase C39 family protein n=1 Tax=Arsenicicoccus sp. oral taxon 190 TaxID=1658671 RepID=UPI00067A2E50|nr:peptidase C39 family protein [Arsenicicoccus sp. oral taxon 190]AKT52447.1 hypothetical protein ADJ73_16330 [Arsenicicoccus sp. oral taxon 190]
MTDFSPSRRALLGGVGAAAAALALPLSSATPSASAAAARNMRLWRCTGSALAGGARAGTRYVNGTVVMGTPQGRTSYTDPYGAGTARTYEQGTWTTGWYTPEFAMTQVVPSWRALTPGGTFITVWLQAITTTGRTTSWFSLGRWSEMTGGSPHRMTVDGQGDAYATVATDTLKARPGYAFRAWRMQVALYRPAGTTATPTVTALNAMSSSVPTGSAVTVPMSPVGVGRGRVLAVPTYSQMMHVGHYPQLNGGGEAWCSGTSTAMLLDYWRVGPSATDTAWVSPRPHTNPQVDHAVSKVFDYGYDGSGNWPFNTAYAGTRGLDAFVTRLRSLNEAERFIAAGIPLAVSTSFSSTQLTGAGFGTSGHLMVIAGFDGAGNVVVNDPASGMRASNAAVRKTYNRAQFENAWARSGGTTYVMRPFSVALPARPAQANW